MSTQTQESRNTQAASDNYGLAATHEVFNQARPFEDVNLYDTDLPLQEAIQREQGGWGAQQLHAYGELAGGELMRLGFVANENKPKLHTHDRYGNRIDRVEFHPAYHQIMRTAIEHGLPSLPWRKPGPGAHVVRSALGYLHSQAESGTGCPLTMTFACIPAISKQAQVAEDWVPKILTTDYDARDLPASEKRGLTIGMGMTEKQGGSDVRANTTHAVPLDQSGPGQAYAVVGHKWFFSAPMCDAFLVLAQAERGLSCFLLPRWRPDGSKNAVQIQRLKDKLGDWANASSEVEFRGAWAVMLGEEGRGVNTILEMVAMTRLDCVTGSAAIMRQAFAQAANHARYRKTFGKLLWEQPLMQNVLADLALESEAAMLLSLRLSRALDESLAGGATAKQAAALVRIGTAIGKYWVCKRAPMMINEAQECLGGAGYIEETILPRLYRQAPLNSIWEGCGNIQCLDVLRAMAREPETVAALQAELGAAKGLHASYDAALAEVQKQLAQTDTLELQARRVVERLALLWQATLLQRSGHTDIAEAFCEARLGNARGSVFGTLAAGAPMAKILERAAAMG